MPIVKFESIPEDAQVKILNTGTTHITPEEVLYFNPKMNSGWAYIAQTVPENGTAFWVAAVRSLSIDPLDMSAQLLYGITDVRTGKHYSEFLDGGFLNEHASKVSIFYQKDGKDLLKFYQRRTGDLSEFKLQVDLPWDGKSYQLTKTLALHRPILYESGDGIIPMGGGINSLYASLVFDQGFWVDFQKFYITTSAPLLQILSRFGEGNHRWMSFILNKLVGLLPAGTVGVGWEILDKNNQRQLGGYTNIDLIIPGYPQITAEESEINELQIQEIDYWNSGHKTYLRKWEMSYQGINLLMETLIPNQESEVMGKYFYEGMIKIFNPKTGEQVGTGMLEQTHDEATD